MITQLITMPQEEAIRAYREFRLACRGNPTGQDQAVMLGLKALAKGNAVIDLREAMRTAGLDPQRRPKLAIARADWETVSYETNWRNRNELYFYRWPSPRRGRPAIAARFDRILFGEVRTGCRAMVPYIPPSIRPANLEAYHVLWEAVWEPVPPVDPMLLKHLHGYLYAVLAVWDLTPLERAVMGQRLTLGARQPN